MQGRLDASELQQKGEDSLTTNSEETPSFSIIYHIMFSEETPREKTQTELQQKQIRIWQILKASES